MMHIARMASLILAFYLLTPTATAYAECAWVMWTKQALLSKGTHAPELEFQAAYKSVEDCVRALDQKDPGHRMMATVLILGDRAWMCLPDTVDPRGPKGGAQ